MATLIEQNNNLEYYEYDDHRDVFCFHDFLIKNDGPRRLKLVHMNIRSMNANFTEFQHMISLLPTDIDIIICSETWSNNATLYANSLPDYFLVSSSQSNKSGGVCIFCLKRTINLVDTSYDPIDGADTVSITFDFENSKNLTLVGVYRSPANDVKVFTDSFVRWFKSRRNTSVFAVVGDFNVCHKRYYSDPSSENFFDSLLECALYPTIITETRVKQETSGSLIDQIFIDYRFLYSKYKLFTGNVDADITDH